MKFKNIYHKKNISFIFIPAGLTSILQPLDIFINKPIKREYKKLIILFKLDKIPKIKRETIL